MFSFIIHDIFSASGYYKMIIFDIIEKIWMIPVNSFICNKFQHILAKQKGERRTILQLKKKDFWGTIYSIKRTLEDHL